MQDMHTTDSIRALDAHLQEIAEKKALPGVSVAAIGPDGILFARGYGRANADGSRLVDEHTMYGIASMSKSMVSLALAMLEQEGRVSFEDPVYRYFPSFRIAGTPRDAITLRHLCMHTAGIPPIEALGWSIAMHDTGRLTEWAKRMRATAPNSMDTLEEIIEYIATCEHKTLGAPGEQMSYCNEGYALLSYVVDQVADMPLEQFLHTRIFEPLGMAHSVLDVDAKEAMRISGGNITSLFERENGDLTCDDAWSVLPPYRGCGLVKSSALDMATYYRCLASGGMHEGRQVIPAAAVERLCGSEFPLTKAPFYCLGLTRRAFDGHIVCEHSGALHGASSHGGFLMGNGYGFAVLCNLGDENINTMVHAMYNHVLGKPLSTSHRWYHPVGRAFSDPQMVVGTYRSMEGENGDLVIAQEGDILVATEDGRRMPLAYCGGTLFMDSGTEDDFPPRIEALIRDGQAWAVRYGTRVFSRIEA